MDQGATSVAESVSARKRARRRGRVLGTFLTLLLVAGLAGGAWWLANRDAGETARPGGGGGGGGGFRRSATTVGVAAATKTDIPIIIDALGTVTPAATVTVRPQVSGVIADVRYREGETVQKDQLLVVLDPRPFQLALDVAQANLARDEAQLQNAQVTLERYRTLLAQNSIARQEVDTQAATVKQLQGTIAANRAAVGTAQLNLAYSRITAPISGRIGLRPVDVGNYVTAGDTTGVAVITQVVPIDVLFTVPEDDVPRIQARVAKGAAPDLQALDRARVSVLGDGKFLSLDNQIDTTTGTVRAKGRFDNRSGTLFPGQFVNIRMLIETIQGAVVVPVSAVRHGSDGDFTYVLNEDSTVKLRRVKRGPGIADKISIVEGVAEGERVVTEGADRLTDGQRVQLPGQAPPEGQGRPGGGRSERGQRGGGQRDGGQRDGGQGAGASGDQAPAGDAPANPPRGNRGPRPAP